MLAEIITIGDEILIGQTIDTNSAWLGNRLNEYGIEVIQITSINDKKSSIIKALGEAEKRADLVLITGGLGPTKDDITKKVLAEYFECDLVYDKSAQENIQTILKRLNREILQINLDQALVPEKCIAIQNSKGTAPGMYFEENNTIYVSMPGVPYEMRAMMENDIFKRLQSKNSSYAIEHHTITVVGIPESHLATSIEHIENSLPDYIKLAYLPHLNLVRLRLSAKSIEHSVEELSTQIQEVFNQIKMIIGDSWFEGETRLSAVVGESLVTNEKTIGTIESCTGGFIASKLTEIPGSSAYFKGSLLTYAYETKISLVKIDRNLLNEVGAVSKEVCEMMAKNAQDILEVDYCISSTGIAGPGGGTNEKPVGLVFIGLAKPDGSVMVEKCQFYGTRQQIVERTSNKALDMLIKAIKS
jgi:nicotinamide-nucleotide amidase